MNFIGLRKYGYIISGILIFVSLYSIIIWKGFQFGIDFTGGVLIQVKFNKSVEVKQIRNALEKKGFTGLIIQRVGLKEENQFIIKSKPVKEYNQLIKDIEKALVDNFGKENIQLPFQRTEVVGPTIGKDLRKQAYKLIVIALILILLYIAYRFQFRFSIGAIIALIHDVTITLGSFSFLEKEINIPIIAAILTIIGYSLNDTIVVYNRIRENLQIMRKEPMDKIINTSISQTLARTLITSITTLLTAVSLFVFGGPIIHDFAFAFIIGIIVGTYSSIFVASPIVYDLWMKKMKH